MRMVRLTDEQIAFWDAVAAKNERRRQVAHAAGLDAGNRSMRAAGRAVWNEHDFSAAVAEYERLLPSEEK